MQPVQQKKKASLLTYSFYVVLLIILASILYIQHTITPFEASATETLQNIVSPIGNLSRMSIASNLWLPKEDAEVTNPNIYLTSQAAFFIDTKDGQVLYQKNLHQKLPIASLTKIMTVIVALEHKDFSDTFKISQRAADTEPDKMLLIGGEKLTLEELLDGIFLVSANDAAEAIAEDTFEDRDEFIKQMNLKAKQLGMENTFFINPSGLEEDDPNFEPDSGHSIEQYSSAYDVALMSRYAISHWPHLVDISSQSHIQLPITQTHQDYDLYNGVNLLTTYPGVVGFKTGYTPDAGLTLVTLARRDGHEVLGVLLGATDRRDDAKALLDYSFKKLGVK